MSAGSIYRVALIGEGFQKQQLVSTFHVRAVDDTILDTQVQDIAQAWQNDCQGLFANTYGNGNLLTTISVRGVSDPTEGADVPVSPGQLGTRTGDNLPPGCSGVVALKSGLVGRRLNGRMFLWPATEGDQNVGVWTSEYMAAMQAYANQLAAFGDGILTARYRQVIRSRVNASQVDVTIPVPRNAVHYQRRRTQGVGS